MNVLNSSILRLRIFAFLEGMSLLILVFIAVPLKYFYNEPTLTKLIGPIHGGLFLLFVVNAFSVGIERSWKFTQTTWKLVVACFIPFGTFYIDRTILRRLTEKRHN